MIGHRLPAVAEELLGAIASGDVRSAQECFTSDGLWGVSSAETDPSADLIVYSASELAAAFSHDSAFGQRVVLRMSAVADERTLVDGILVEESGRMLAEFALSLEIRDQLISRGVMCRIAPAAHPFDTTRGLEPSPDIEGSVYRYFRELRLGNFSAAAQQFSETGIYLHPPFDVGGSSVAFQGHAEIEAGFAGRGVRPWYQHVEVLAQHGPYALLEGRLYASVSDFEHDEEPKGVFLSNVTVDAVGQLQRYQAFYGGFSSRGDARRFSFARQINPAKTHIRGVENDN